MKATKGDALIFSWIIPWLLYYMRVIPITAGSWPVQDDDNVDYSYII